MSGFLRRLAAHAMGVARPVRSVARLPFAPIPTFAEETVPVATRGTSLDVEPALKPVIPDHFLKPKRPVWDRAPQSGDSASKADSRGLNTDAPLPVTSPAEPQGAEFPHTAVETRQRHSDHFAPGGVDVTQLSATGLTQSAKALPETATESEGQRLRIPHVRFAEPLLPARPLVRSQITAALGPALTTHAAPGSQVGGRSAAAAETTEVHVNIGRIEVTAVHEAPSKKPKGAPARKPMSLDEYLSRRQRSRT